MSGKVWRDIKPTQWYYRSVLEADRLYLDPLKEDALFNGKLYNKFIAGKPRQVHNYTTTEGQTKFKITGYKPDSREQVIVYVEGVPTAPTKLEKDYVTVGFPMSSGKEVSVFLGGIIEMHQGDDTPENCRTYPVVNECALQYPSKKLDMQDKYIFDLKYSLNEVAVCMGQKLQRVNVTMRSGETTNAALERTLAYRVNCFTILNGYLYTTFNLNGFPILVNYNYKVGAVVKNRQREKAVPTSNCVKYNDMFFPQITIPRSEFFVLLERMRKNFYNKYTDRPYKPNHVSATTRYISDRKNIVGKWYDQEVLNILDETFNDGCYVFPLYDDDTFLPNVCVTRAEAIVYLNRLTEWALERFR